MRQFLLTLVFSATASLAFAQSGSFTTLSVTGSSTLGTLTVGAPGLVGDGVTDNTTALQNAFTAAQSVFEKDSLCGFGVIHRVSV